MPIHQSLGQVEMVNIPVFDWICLYYEETCGYTLQCLGPFGPSGNGSCHYIKYATAGETCRTSASCATPRLECYDGKCHLKADTYCVSSEDCPFGTFCKRNATLGNSTCIPTLPLNAECDLINNYGCDIGLVCTYNTTTRNTTACLTIGSRGLGAPCFPYDVSQPFNGTVLAVDCDPGQGLLCMGNDYYNMTCQIPSLSPVSQQGNGTRCEYSPDDDTCTYSQTCVCPTNDMSNRQCAMDIKLDGSCAQSIVVCLSIAVIFSVETNVHLLHTMM
ncbi:hypothetical protein SAMD00019534_121410 [Acytostelium subglobosum LB1]|uniref:hypothetical protein n=1 Tax=Acytostelium subglobosum LB1 TaxID=1410327 RepID=UPI000644EDC4|nr:hypothetical protein SAMD00019534_121410 [Acytostelium subglobosum LB1]GAM28965.1 hypothetical protein SAMD00019534_121410 [Acytostelium subglobosum LB1]|eukprot:XP_012748150.1 hypothetical protein SAMD00019534_121410 [Acytostelium subglobosum LB1]